MKNLIFKSSFHEKLKLLIIPMMLLTLGVGQMWGADVQKNTYLYFDNSASGWSYSYTYFVINDNTGYLMSAISNTKLYVHKRTDNTWSGYSYIRLAGNGSSWGNPASMGGYDNMNSYIANFTNTYNNYTFNGDNFYYIKPDKAGSKSSQANLSVGHIGSGYTALNKTITIKAKVSTNNGSTYSETTSPATLTASSYKFTNYNTCTTGTSLSSGTITCGYTATTTLTAPSTDPTGYTWVGWYNSSGTRQTTSKTLTIYPTANATYYAYYRKLYTISAGSTIVWDLAGNDANSGNAPWSAVYLYKDIEGGSASNDAFTQCGSTTQYAKNYESAVSNMKVFLFRERNDNTWSTYKQTTDIYSDVSGVTLFTYCNSATYSDNKYKLDWQKTADAKKATSGVKVYFDNTASNWGEIWMKYGTQWFNRHTGAAASEVPGTDALYVITIPNDCYYEKYVLADTYGYTNYNNITADNNISNRIAHQTLNIASEITYIPTTGTGSSPKVWSFETISGGHSRTLTFGSHTNGQITVRYTDENGVEHTVSSADASTVTVAQTCKVIISAVPNSGYAPSGLTLNSSAITSGAEQIIRADGTIAATFVAETTHDVTVSYKYGDRTLHANNVIAVGETTPSDISSEAVDGFSFSSWSNLTSGIVNVTGNTSTDPIRIKTTADGSMTCNYTQWPCSLDINTTSGNTGYSSRVAMSYDATVKAYYKNFTTTVAKQYFRFYINSKKYAPSSDTEVVIAGTKVAAATDVTGYASDMPSVYFDDGGVGSNITIWFDYENKKAWVTEQKHTVTIQAGNHGSVSPTSVSVGNVVASGTITATADSHYHWSSWSLPNSGVTIASGSGTKSITIKATADGKTVTANFAGDVYSITYKDKGGSDFSGTQTTPPTSHTYGTATTLKIPTKTGYDFGGWFTSSDCSTGQVGTTSSATLGATDYTANIILYAKWDAKTYRVTFDATTNGGTCATEYKDVTYGSTYGELPTATKSAQQFAGWYTTASGVGSKVEATTTVATANDHTLYARFEATYRVQVDYKCGSTTLRPSTEVHASASIIGAEITAPEILGYNFVNWTGTNATFVDANAKTTTVHASTTTTVTANYVAVPMVYFKNNLDWDDVYVSFNCGWTSGSKPVPTNNGKPYYKMTQLGTSDIFYCIIPSTYTDNNYANWAGNIAFDNKGFGNYTTTHTGNSNGFNSGKFLGRGDFDPNATMFIPYNGATESRNGGTYYTRGCWIQYNSNYSGYKVRVNTYVQGSGGEYVQNVELRSTVAGATEFTAKVWLDEANYTYGVMLYKDYAKNSSDLWYTNVNNEANTITSATTSLPWAWEPCTDSWQRCRVKAETQGDYIFTVSFATGIPMVDIEYPVTVGDFRLDYSDAATWSQGWAHNDGTPAHAWHHTSRVIKHLANAKDTVSFFVSYGSSPSVKLQKCTDITAQGVQTWTDQSTVSLSSIKKAGVYNFKVTQSANASSATVAVLGAYTGNYYICSDASDGGWTNYTDDGNKLTYSEYSLTHGGSFGPYSHYYMRHVNSGSNIKFCIANDYSMAISDTVVDDTYAHEWIEREANVRFMWYQSSNKIGRAYISGSSNVSDRFLVLEGDELLFNEAGLALTTAGGGKVAGLNDYEMNFTDDQNWVYEATVQAKPFERIKLTAKFGDNVQYFYGAEGPRSQETTHQLIGGTGTDKYKIRVVYDFKTNRLLAAWLPTETIASTLPIDADVMIIRYHQEDAQQITFSDGGSLSKVKTVYGAMKFNKYRLNNQDEDDQHDLGISTYERDLFFISFPFDVKLNDVFGFGTYGKHWIIEYYDGKTRAKNGYWKDSPTNWKFVTQAMKDSYTLKANEGYVLALDLDELGLSSPVWNYGVENVYLYFPSTASVENIQATHITVDIDTVGYQCTINRNTTHGDRRVKDSHWHLIGVPSYANADHTASTNWSTDTDLEQTIYYPNITPAQWQSVAPYVYVWDPEINKFGVNSSSKMTFKPMHSYLVQYARDTLEWRQVNTTPAAIAARRAMYAKEPCEFHLELQQNDQTIDQTFISMRDDEEVTAEFDFNYDLSKMLYGAFTSKSNIYTFAGNEEVAANCLPFKDETTVVPVGVTVNEGEEGEYIFSIPEGTNGVGVTLVDNERQIRTNLALTDYMTYLTAGEYTERFVLEISPIEQTTTSVETVNGANGDASLNGEKVTGVCKKLIDGVLYIVKDGKVFDARGARVQ